jgi:hypothetical protein
MAPESILLTPMLRQGIPCCVRPRRSTDGQGELCDAHVRHQVRVQREGIWTDVHRSVIILGRLLAHDERVQVLTNNTVLATLRLAL